MKLARILLTIFTVFLVGLQSYAEPNSAGIQDLQKQLLDENKIMNDYKASKRQVEHFAMDGPVDEYVRWNEISKSLLSKLNTSLRQSVSLALKMFAIPSFDSKSWGLKIDPDLSVDWSANPNQGTLGSHAFQSAGWLGASLAALSTLRDHQKDWPQSSQAMHLALALSAKRALANPAELSLTADETARINEIEQQHENALDSSLKTLLDKQQWPPAIPLAPVNASKPVTLYTPPILYSTDRMMTISLVNEEGPVSNVPIVLGDKKLSGFTLKNIVVTNSEGLANVPLESYQSAILVLPYLDNGPFPHRLQFFSTGAEIAPGPPIISPAPIALEPMTDTLLSGTNLTLNQEKTEFMLGNEPLPILASTPSFIVTKIPPRLPGPRELKIATTSGSQTFDLPIVSLIYQIKNLAVHRGEPTELTIKELGTHSLNALIATDRPRLLFENGMTEETVTLEENKEMTVPMKGFVPGPYHLTALLDIPIRQEILKKMESMMMVLTDDHEKQLLLDARWEFLEGHVSMTQSLLEELRYERLLRGEKALPQLDLDAKFLLNSEE